MNNKEQTENAEGEVTKTVIDQAVSGSHAVKVELDLNHSQASSGKPSPWWESKLLVALVSGVFAVVIPGTTAITGYFEHINQEQRLKTQYQLEITEKALSQLSKNSLSKDAKLALYTFLIDVNEADSGTAKFAEKRSQEIIASTRDALDKQLQEVKTTQDKAAKLSEVDENSETKSQSYERAVIAEKALAKSIQANASLLQKYTNFSKVEPSPKTTVVSQWDDIELSNTYQLRSKFDKALSFNLYNSRPSTLGTFGDKIGSISEGQNFKVKQKYVTFRGFKWLQIELLDSGIVGWYSWENIRSELIEP